MPFTTTRTVLFGDCDPAGIVYTPRVADYVTEAVHDFTAHLLGGSAVRKLFGTGILPPARALSIEYHAPMVWDDVIEIEVGCTEAKTTSFTFFLVGRKAPGTIMFRSSFTQVYISSDTHQPVPIPEALRSALMSENPV